MQALRRGRGQLPEPEQARGVSAEDLFLLSAPEFESADDFDRLLIAHIKAVIAAHHHPIHANELSEII